MTCCSYFVTGIFREGFTELMLKERDRGCNRWRKCYEQSLRKYDQLPQASSGQGLLAVNPF